MSRDTYRATNIPSPTDSPLYLDAHQIAKGVGAALGESFMGQVTGAGGAGGTLANVPFEPAVIDCINQAGIAPAFTKYVNLASGVVGVTIILAAAAAAACTITDNGDGTFDILLPTSIAPDGEVVTVVVTGFTTPGSL